MDWWSLGIVAFEMITGERPYDIHSQTGVAEVRQLFSVPLRMPSAVDKQLADIIKRVTKSIHFNSSNPYAPFFRLPNLLTIVLNQLLKMTHLIHLFQQGI